ncbi:MAG: stage II sporulation protein D [Anaerovoracaceae bacterium]
MKYKMRRRRFKFNPRFWKRLHNKIPLRNTWLIKWVSISLMIVLFTLIILPFSITRLLSSDEKPTKDFPKKIPQEISSSKIFKAKVPSSIKVYRTDTHRVDLVNFENYVKGVVSSEMPSSFANEALKAQAVAARTYSLSKFLSAKDKGNPSAHPSAPVCDSVHCQVYKGKNELKKFNGSDWMKNGWKKVSKAVDDTKGQLIYYNGKIIDQALFHSSSGGKTENCEDVFTAAVPYLVSVSSPYEDKATHKNEKTTLTISDFSRKIKAAYPNNTFGNISMNNIRIKSHSSGGRAENITVGKSSLPGTAVRQTLGLPSANFVISLNKGTITFTTNGSGHGVGMSQYGADGMARKGYEYTDILTHYYKGTVIC